MQIESYNKMKVVYVAGPFRADSSWKIEQNVRKAEEIALEIWKTGKAAAICPHSNTRYYQYEAPDEVWLEGDLAIILKCDAVLFMDNYTESAGALEEERISKLENVRRFYSLSALKEWLNE